MDLFKQRWHGRLARAFFQPKSTGETPMPPLLHLAVMAIAGFTLMIAIGAMAEDKKKEEKNEMPRLMAVAPFSVIRGSTSLVHITGLNLAEVSAVRMESTGGPITAVIKSHGKLEGEKKGDPAKVGDSQVELEINVPPDGIAESVSFILTTKTGETPPRSLVVLTAGSLIEEKEPNGGFREAQEIDRGKTVRGTISDATDVDVFKFQGKAGEKIVAEVDAARHGSPLDSLLTLYSAKGNTLASNDDSEAGADSILRAKLPADGVYYLSLSDAQGVGGAAHGYLLCLRHTEATTRPAVPAKP